MVGNKSTKELYKEAFCEVNEIINMMPNSLSQKIPDSFKKFIQNNKSQDYKFEINKNKLLDEGNLKKETCIILSLIYRSYLCTKEEQESLNDEDMKELDKRQRKLEEKYSSEGIFPQQTAKIEEKRELLVLNEKENYFTKILNNIKDFLLKFIKR